MSYVKHILLPGEKVLYDGHVHPRVMLHGLIFMGIAAGILMEAAGTGEWRSVLLMCSYKLSNYFSWADWLYNKLSGWQEASPDTSLDFKVMSILIGAYGFYHLVIALIIMETTELIVTDKRIIAKMGVFNVITLEMDRTRVAGVTVYQSLAGRIMNYGYIFIQGFTSSIGGLPVMVNPHMVEKFVS